MYDIYFWTTPNGYKILLFAEEAAIPYKIKPVNISKGQQFNSDFLLISPNSKIPALVDHEPVTGNGPLSIFESGAILLYLAEKTGQFIPSDLSGRVEVLQWLVWQVGNLGPMAGQNHHFARYAPEKIPYAIERYVFETNRLYGVLDRHLADQRFVAGDAYTIADMAAYPWILPEQQSQNLDDFPNLKRWKYEIAARPATLRAYARGSTVNTAPIVTKESAENPVPPKGKAVVRHGIG